MLINSWNLIFIDQAYPTNRWWHWCTPIYIGVTDFTYGTSEIGDTGESGETSEIGETGDTVEIGEIGEVGETGDVSEIGEIGETGDTVDTNGLLDITLIDRHWSTFGIDPACPDWLNPLNSTQMWKYFTFCLVACIL